MNTKTFKIGLLFALLAMISCLQFCKKDETTTVSYKVTLNYNGKDTANTTLTFSGTALTLPTPSRAGYTLNGWYDAATAGNKISSAYTPTKDITLYAQWTGNSNTIKFNSNGGSAVADASVITDNKLSTPTAPTKTGYTFVGWYSDAALTTAYNFNTAVSSSFTLYAKWIVGANTIVFNTNGGSTVSDVSVATGNTLTEPIAPTKTGYTFAGWHTDAGLTTAYNFTTAVSSSFTLYAKWIAGANTIVFNTNGGSAVSDVSVTSGNTLTEPTAPTKTGYTFAGWYKEQATTNAYDFATTVTSGFTLYAKWTGNPNTISFNTNGGSEVSDVSVATGNTLTEPIAPTKTGYTFAGWHTDAGLTTAYNFTTTVTSGFNLYAKWTANSNTIVFNSNGGSTISDASVTTGNILAEPTAPTKTGYTFAGWYKEQETTNAYDFATTVTSGFTLYAKWTGNPNTISFNTNGGSAVSDVSVTSGNTLTEPTAPTKTGYGFVGWYTDAAFTTLYDFTATVTSGFNLYARWFKTVTIGSQIWMAENLNDAGNTLGTSFCYNNDANNCTTYGRLYDWPAARDIDLNIPGWHLPTDAEWTALETSLGGASVAGNAMKVGGGSGFDALMAGGFYANGGSSLINQYTTFWSATFSTAGTSFVWARYTGTSIASLERASNGISNRFSVRLVKD